LQTPLIKDVRQLLKTGEPTLFTQKTDSQRKIYLSPGFKKDLLHLDIEENENYKLIQRAGHPKSSMHPLGYIVIVNKFIKDTLGQNYTSHSFRQGTSRENGCKGH